MSEITATRVKKRKQRAKLSCAECRRTKLKCDRKVPCDNCIKRECRDICPDGVRASTRKTADVRGIMMMRRLERLEDELGLEATSDASARRTRASATEELSASTGSVVSETTGGLPVAPGAPATDIDSSVALQGQPSAFALIPQSLGVYQPHELDGPSDGTAFTFDYSTEALSAGDMGETATGSDLRLSVPRDPVSHSQAQHAPNSQLLSPTTTTQKTSGPIPAVPMSATSQLAVTTADTTGVNSQVYGTLLLGQGGRSKYLGPTAGSEWLKDQEVLGDESQMVSRNPSPEPFLGQTSGFPFNAYLSTAELLNRLPSQVEATRLVDCYFRYFAWQHNIVPRPSFTPMFESIYDQLRSVSGRLSGTERINHHVLGLVFAVLAMGTLHDLELETNDALATEYLEMARRSLTRGNFLQDNTVAALQALHVIAHVSLETEGGKNGDSAWPLWGLSMRIVVAMGLHRDGARWGLDDKIVQERRLLYWQCQSTDVMQANCFSRPYADTMFPHDLDPERNEPITHKSFHQLKYELSQISEDVIEASLKLREPSMETIRSLQDRLIAFEKAVPFQLRCRTAYLSLPSLYPEQRDAITDTPEINKRDLRLTLQQFTLAITISETMLFLNRPFYAKAFQGCQSDPMQSPHGQAYLTVVERANLMTTLVATLYDLLPRVTVRFWWLWYHAFTAAVCLGTLPLISPKNLLVEFALCQLDATISLFTRASHNSRSRRLARNLDWMCKLKARIVDKVTRPQTSGGESNVVATSTTESDDEDGGLLGWRTRLVQRATKGGQVVKTIQPSPSSVSPMMGGLSGGQIIPSGAVDRVFASADGSETTDQLLHDFWDPMLLHTNNDPLDYNQLSEWWDMCMAQGSAPSGQGATST